MNLAFDRPPSDDNPNHYRVGSSGVECIEIVRCLSFDLGNAIKYMWRLGNKDEDTKELKKAIWYLVDEITVAVSLHSLRKPRGLFLWNEKFETHILSLPAGDRVTAALDHIRQGVLGLGVDSWDHFDQARILMVEEALDRGVKITEIRTP